MYRRSSSSASVLAYVLICGLVDKLWIAPEIELHLRHHSFLSDKTKLCIVIYDFDCLHLTTPEVIISAALLIRHRTGSNMQAPIYSVNENMWKVMCDIGSPQIFAFALFR